MHRFTSSASLVERKDPSPNLFNDDNGGNLHSIFLGDLIAACIDCIA